MQHLQFGELEHAMLAQLFYGWGGAPYKGYKPDTRESPNSDGKIDHGKRYLHVAPKYEPPSFAISILAAAHYEACRVAEEIGVPAAFYPRVENGTLRVLEYPAGAGTEEHTDFDLFTLNLWRSTPNDHEQEEVVTLDGGGKWWTHGAPRFHMGRIGSMLGLGPAVRHRVPARDYPQRALVYFAMPANAAVFPAGSVDVHEGTAADWSDRPVSAWLDVVYAASRVPAYK